MSKEAQQAAALANALEAWRDVSFPRYTPTPTVAALIYARHAKAVAALPVA